MERIGKTQHFMSEGTIGVRVKIMLPYDPEGKKGTQYQLPDIVTVKTPVQEKDDDEDEPQKYFFCFFLTVSLRFSKKKCFFKRSYCEILTFFLSYNNQMMYDQQQPAYQQQQPPQQAYEPQQPQGKFFLVVF